MHEVLYATNQYRVEHSAAGWRSITAAAGNMADLITPFFFHSEFYISTVYLRLAHNTQPRSEPYMAFKMDQNNLDLRGYPICDMDICNLGFHFGAEQDCEFLICLKLT